MFSRHYDYIADCIDLVKCKLDLICTALERNVPILSAMGTGNKVDPFQLRITDLSKTEGCHLARVMRRGAARRGIEHTKVLFSPEVPIKPAPLVDNDRDGAVRRPAAPGSPSCAGLMMGGYIVQALIEPATEKQAT